MAQYRRSYDDYKFSFQSARGIDPLKYNISKYEDIVIWIGKEKYYNQSLPKSV